MRTQSESKLIVFPFSESERRLPKSCKKDRNILLKTHATFCQFQVNLFLLAATTEPTRSAQRRFWICSITSGPRGRR